MKKKLNELTYWQVNKLKQIEFYAKTENRLYVFAISDKVIHVYYDIIGNRAFYLCSTRPCKDPYKEAEFIANRHAYRNNKENRHLSNKDFEEKELLKKDTQIKQGAILYAHILNRFNNII